MKYLISSLLLVLLIQPVESAERAFEYDPPGRYTLMFGTHRIYFHCIGEGTPTVVIEPGIGDTLANWLPIQEKLGPHTRTCVYDRAGNGLSNPGSGPRTVALISLELYVLLKQAKIEGPYVIVGHSFGGFVAQYFASRFPDDTAGVVLVDSSHPDQVERLADLDTLEDSPKITVGGYRFEDESLLSPAQKLWKHLNAQRKSVWTQMDELGSFGDSAREVAMLNPFFPDIPLAVLSRGKNQLPVLPGIKSLEVEWQAMQKELTALSSRSWQEIARNSGHSIHQEAPGMVIDNTLKVVRLVRDDMQSRTSADR